jgi:enoyl-[acyl-carrier protein] reductase II
MNVRPAGPVNFAAPTPHAVNSRIPDLFGIRFPLVQAGMIWNSGWRLAAAVSEAGGLGVIGSGSMYPEVLRHHVRSCKAASAKPFAVNIPMLYPDVDKHIATVIEEGVPIVFTSAGNPATWTRKLKDAGITVVHVTASVKFARKAEEAGADAVVAEGFEAGGHNGREETTTLVLVPLVRKAVQVPVIAAGGIADGASMLAAFALGAEAVQMGSRFVASEESSAHAAFKQHVVTSLEGDTQLTLKELAPVRMMKNAFYREVQGRLCPLCHTGGTEGPAGPRPRQARHVRGRPGAGRTGGGAGGRRHPRGTARRPDRPAGDGGSSMPRPRTWQGSIFRDARLFRAQAKEPRERLVRLLSDTDRHVPALLACAFLPLVRRSGPAGPAPRGPAGSAPAALHRRGCRRWRHPHLDRTAGPGQ